jgi:hypothetical protein
MQTSLALIISMSHILDDRFPERRVRRALERMHGREVPIENESAR